MSDELTPITRKETFLAKAGGQNVVTPTPITREETFLQAIIDNGSGGGGGGGGALIVHLDGDGVFDKTWQECTDAIDAGIIVLVMKYSAETGHLYKILCGWDSEDGYALFSVDNYSEPYAWADTANGYPRDS